MKKIIVQDLETVLEVKKDSGHEVFVGQYCNKRIQPRDQLLFENSCFIQKGVERKGCYFEVTEEDIAYTIEDTKCILESGRNLKGGNATLVFFMYDKN